jgi:hypothetical protein
VGLRLGNEHSIKRVAVGAWQGSGTGSVSYSYRQFLETLVCDVPRQV